MDTLTLIIVISLTVMLIVIFFMGIAILSLLTRQQMMTNETVSLIDEFLMTVMRYTTMKGIDKLEIGLSKGLKTIYSKMRNIDVTIETPQKKEISKK